MSNRDEPITNNPLLPFLRIPSLKSTLPPSRTPIQTMAVGQQKLGVDIRMEEEESAVKPLWRHCCPNYRVLYMKEGEIRLLGIHVSSKKCNPPNPNTKITIVVQVSSSAPAMLLVLGLLLTTAGGTKVFRTIYFGANIQNGVKACCEQMAEFRCQGHQLFYLIYIEWPI